jgi:hypothetical protein
LTEAIGNVMPLPAAVTETLDSGRLSHHAPPASAHETPEPVQLATLLTPTTDVADDDDEDTRGNRLPVAGAKDWRMPVPAQAELPAAITPLPLAELSEEHAAEPRQSNSV